MALTYSWTTLFYGEGAVISSLLGSVMHYIKLLFGNGGRFPPLLIFGPTLKLATRASFDLSKRSSDEGAVRMSPRH